MSDPLLDEIDDALSKAVREIEALRAERAQLTAEIDYLRASFTKACKTLGEAEAERDRLREALGENLFDVLRERDRLREALTRIANADEYHGHGLTVREIARAALAKEVGQ